MVVRPGAEWVFTIAYELAFVADAAFHQHMSRSHLFAQLRKAANITEHARWNR